MSLNDMAHQSRSMWPQKGEGDEAPASRRLKEPSVAQQFTGLCIGGPYDGMKTTHFMNVLTLPAIADVPAVAGTVELELHLFNYEHVSLPVPSAPGTRGITRHYGFWVPKGNTLLWALDELAEAYVNSGGSVPK
jgi:hypothetical protein